MPVESCDTDKLRRAVVRGVLDFFPHAAQRQQVGGQSGSTARRAAAASELEFNYVT
jgi:hypothetical protein